MEDIRRMAVACERLPLDLDLGERYARIDALGYVLVGLEDGAGRLGVGSTFSIDLAEARAIEAAARERAALVLGATPADHVALWERLRDACASLPRGVGAPCVSAFDVACLDLLGKQRGEPVHRLLGAGGTRLHTYASDDLWPSLADDVLARNAARFAGEGFTSLKIRTGASLEPGRERARVLAVRSAVGPEVEILYDALQCYDASTAIALGRALADCDLGWLEDPVPEDDLAGLAAVRSASEIPIASGEDATWPQAHRALLDAGAVDVLMVDPKWIGGLTPWCALARELRGRPEKGVRMTSHISPELCAPVLAAFAPEAPLEWFSWSFGLYEVAPRVDSGHYSLPEAPGFGLHYRGDLLGRLSS